MTVTLRLNLACRHGLLGWTVLKNPKNVIRWDICSLAHTVLIISSQAVLLIDFTCLDPVGS